MSFHHVTASSWPYHANHRPGIHPDCTAATQEDLGSATAILLFSSQIFNSVYSEFKKKERMGQS